MAEEIIKVMAGPAGATFPTPSPTINFAALLAADALVNQPPRSLGEDLGGLARLNELIDLGARIAGALRHI